MMFLIKRSNLSNVIDYKISVGGCSAVSIKNIIEKQTVFLIFCQNQNFIFMKM